MSSRVIHQLDLDARWFPRMVIDAPESFNLAMLRHEFMLDDSANASIDGLAMKSLQSIKKVRVSPPITIDVFNTQARAKQVPAVMHMPELQSIYKGPNPGQVYDLAAVKFKSSKSSQLWLSAAIPPKSNYFLNIARIPLAHAAATRGSGLLHSALVEHEGMGILLPGAAFSGKSSISVFAMLTGATLISDDLVLVNTRSSGATAARSFRRTLLMRERTHDLLPENIRVHAQAASINGVTKYAYDRAMLGTLTGIETKVKRIVLPSISTSILQGTNHGYQLQPIDKATTLQLLVQCLDSSVLMPGLGKERSKVTAGLLNLVTRTPCFTLRMDSRFLDAPEKNCHQLLCDIVSMKSPLQAITA